MVNCYKIPNDRQGRQTYKIAEYFAATIYSNVRP